MTNNKVFIFTDEEMDMISEAFYYHFFDDRTEPCPEDIKQLGLRIGAITKEDLDEEA